jgi:DNA-binding NtrC family response regulator
VDDLPETLRESPMAKFAKANGDSELPDNPMRLEEALQGPERRIIESALKRNSWNRQSTAAELDINRTTLYKKMRKYRLDVGEEN